MLKYAEYITFAAALVVALGLFVLTLLYGSSTSIAKRPQQQQSERHEVEKNSSEAEKTLWQKVRTDPIALFTFWLVIHGGPQRRWCYPAQVPRTS